jgi:putative flippase GtrA
MKVESSGISSQRHLGLVHDFLRELLIAKSDDGFVQLVRYTAVGGVSFVADFGILFAASGILGVHYLISAPMGFIVGLTVNYALSVHWVFASRQLRSRRLEFAAFFVIGVVGLGLNELIMWVLTDKVYLHYLVSKIGATLVVFIWNFLARKKLLF